MSEPETETETLDRIEAALTRIAAETASLRRRAANDHTGDSDALRADIAASLDSMIASLRDTLGEPPVSHHESPDPESNRG